MEKTLLVVGIDPGTTTAIAALELNTKRVMFLDSSKNFTISRTISTLVGLGKTVAVGSDKRNVPSFVQKLATKLGSRVVLPLLDLSVREKKELTRDYRCRNDHEQDALASALYAYDKIQYLVEKINRRVRSKHKERLSESIKEIVIKKEGTSFTQAVEKLEKPSRRSEEKRGVPKEETEYTQLLHRYNKLRRELKIKNGMIERLKKSLSNKNSLMQKLQNDIEKVKARKLTKERRDQLLDFKEKRIKAMQDMIDSQKKVIDELKKEIKNQGVVERIVKEYRKGRV